MAAPSQVEVAKTTNRLMWLSDEAYGHGWTLLARYRDTRITYVLVDEHGETEFDTLDEVEREMGSMCRIRIRRLEMSSRSWNSLTPVKLLVPPLQGGRFWRSTQARSSVRFN